MNIVIFSPGLTSSAIGRMVALVTNRLVANGHGVTVVRTEAIEFLAYSCHDFGAPLLSWENSNAVLFAVRAADAVVYQVGDNYPYHEGAVHWLAQVPGIICLHDFFLGNLFYGWAQHNLTKAQIILTDLYGAHIASRFFSFSNIDSFIDAMRNLAPLTEWICSQATGVITHSQWGIDRVQSSCFGPLKVVPLAYNAVSLSSPSAKQDSGKDEELALLTVGHVNRNKRIESVIKAIGFHPTLRKRINYQLVGPIAPEVRDGLQTLAEGLNVNLKIHGEVDDLHLTSAFRQCDAVVCLRWPTLEAASASAIEAMLHGKALIVTEAGFYAEIPDACAIKIGHANEFYELQTALIRLIEKKSLCLTMGSSAKEWASRTFTESNYANELLAMISQVARSLPKRTAFEFFEGTIRRWANSDKNPFWMDSRARLDIFN